MKGVPLRLEIGPNEMEAKEVTAARRDNGEQQPIDLDNLEEKVGETLDDIQNSLFDGLKEYQQENIREADSKMRFLLQSVKAVDM